MSLFEYVIGLLGVWFFADGVASLWTYIPKKNETWWRNHSLRVVRMLGGLTVASLVWLNGL